MQAIIHQWAFNGSFDQLASLPRQELVNDWFGYDVEPSAEFAFATDGQFSGSGRPQQKPPCIRKPGPASFSRNCGGSLAEWFTAVGDQLLGIQPAQRRVVSLRLYRCAPRE
ncbi:MAG: hypothetical protein ACLSUW_07245 [Akkermansia sp.]